MTQYYLMPDGQVAITLKEVRKFMKVSGRKLPHLIHAGIVKKIIEPLNVNNDETTEESK